MPSNGHAGHISVGGYLKDRNAKITVREAEQLFQELWTIHEQALLLAFERRFQLVEARLKAEIGGQPVDEAQFVADTKKQARVESDEPEDEASDLS